MNLKSLSLKSLAIVNVLIFFAIIAVVLHLAERHFIRLDLTAKRVFSLSKGTLKVLNSLDDVLHIKVYMSEDLPPEFAPLTRLVKDTCEEFAYSGKKNVSLSYIDPKNDDKLKAELNQMGILEMRAQVRKKDRFEVKNIFYSLGFFYRNQKEIIRDLSKVSNIELEFVRSIKKLLSVRMPKLAYITGFDTLSLDNENSKIYQSLLKTFNIVKVDVEKGEKIPDDTDVLFVAGPRKPVSEWALYEIDRYLMNGGKVVAFVNRIMIAPDYTKIVPVESGLEKLFAHYGIAVNGDMVCDNLKHGSVNYQIAGRTIRKRYPPMVALDNRSFKKYENPITSDLKLVYIPWTSSLTLDMSKLAEHTIHRLAASSDQTTVQTSTFILDPERMRPIGEKKERLLGVLVNGRFESYFKGKPKPQAPASAGATQPKPTPPPAGGEAAAEPVTTPESVDNGYVAVFGSSNVASDSTYNMFRGGVANELLVLNLFEYLTLGKDLIGIRAKTAQYAKVSEETLNKSKGLLWFFNLALMPFLLLLLCLGYKLWSYLNKKKYEEFVGR